MLLRQCNTNVQKTHPNLIFFSICSEKNPKKTKPNNNNKTVYSLATFWSSCGWVPFSGGKKSKMLGPPMLLCSTQNKSIILMNTRLINSCHVSQHVHEYMYHEQVANKYIVFYVSPVCEPLWCKLSWMAWSHLSHNQESTYSTGALRKSIAQSQRCQTLHNKHICY